MMRCGGRWWTAFVVGALSFGLPGQASAQAADMKQVMLRQGTPVLMELQETLSSRRSREGDRFRLRVSEPVRVEGIIVIPVGTSAVGEVTKVVKKGAFGRSGKLDTRLLYVQMGDERIPLTGRANDEGEGGTGATVAVAVVAGVFSAFVTGTSAELPVGSILTAYVATDQPMLVSAVAPTARAITVPDPSPMAVVPAATGAEAGTKAVEPPR